MDVTDVVDLVAAEYGVLSAEITSPTRRQPVAIVRQLVIYLLRTTTDHTLCEIGAALNRHHATIHHAVAAIELRRTDNTTLDSPIRSLTAQIIHKP